MKRSPMILRKTFDQPIEREVDPLTHCPFNKHFGKDWYTVLEEDREYIEWLVVDFLVQGTRLCIKLEALLEGDEE